MRDLSTRVPGRELAREMATVDTKIHLAFLGLLLVLRSDIFR